jgi:SNF2-related domain
MTAKAAAAVEAKFKICITGTSLQNRSKDVGSTLYFLRIEPLCDLKLYHKGKAGICLLMTP